MVTNEKLFEISNRLKSIKGSNNPAINHIIAGADDIYDDTREMKQSDINQAVDNSLYDLADQITIEKDRAIAAENNRYTKQEVYNKTETYSAEEVRSWISTPTQNYVTVTATSSTTAATDVLPDSSQATDTIYRVANWDGSANSGDGGYDVSTYSEYAWDGTSYVFLCVKTQALAGDVFDISDHTDGAAYLDISAALGTNGANVPLTVRKGGMSVKFKQVFLAQYSVVKTEGLNAAPATGTLLGADPEIESGTYIASLISNLTLPISTGDANAVTYYIGVTVEDATTYTSWTITKQTDDTYKYTLYRLTATSWSMDLKDWELDVTNKILTDDFIGILSEATDYLLCNGYVASDGTVSGSSTDHEHAEVPVVAGEIYYIVVTGTGFTCRAAYATSFTGSNAPINLVPGTTVMPVSARGLYYKFVIPEGCKYLLFNVGNARKNVKCFKHYYDSREVNESINSVIKDLSTRITLLAIADGYIGVGGVYHNSSTYRHAAVPVTPGDRFILDNFNNAYENRIMYAFTNTTSFEDGHNFIEYCVEGSYLHSLPFGRSALIVIPEGCSCLIFCAGAKYEPRLYKVFDNICTQDDLSAFDDSITNVASNLEWQLETMFYSFRVKPDTTTGKFVNSGRNGYSSFYAPVTAGELLKIECKYPCGAGAVCFSAAVPAIDGDCTDVVSFTTAGVKIVTAPYNGYIVIYKADTTSYLLYKKAPNIDTYIKHAIKANYTKNAGIDCAEGSDTYGEQVSLKGNTLWGVTDAVDISKYSYVSFIVYYTPAGFAYSSTNNYCIGSMFYDENMSPIQAIAITKCGELMGGSGYCVLKRPDTAKYIRVCKYVSGTDYTLIFGIDRTPAEVSDEVRNAITEAVVDVEKDIYAPVQLTEYPYNISLEGTFFTSTSYKHSAFQVEEGEKYLIKGRAEYGRYAFATSDEYTPGGNIPLVEGTSVIPSTEDTYYPITIPEGCIWVLLNGAITSNDVRKVAPVSEQIENAISGLDVDVTQAYINDYKEVEVIDLENLDSYSQRAGSFASGGSWKYVSGSTTTYHLIFDVFGDDCMIKVTANPDKNAYIAFVDDISLPITDGTIPFVEGTSCIIVPPGETKYLVVPKETVATLVHLGSTGGYKPDAITIYRNRNARDVYGTIVSANRIGIGSTPTTITTSSSYEGVAMKVRKDDILYLSMSLSNQSSSAGYRYGVLESIPVYGADVSSFVTVSGTIGLYRRYRVGMDGWFVFSRNKAVEDFTITRYGAAIDNVVKRDEESFQKYLKTLNYEEVDLLNLQLYSASIRPTGVFGATDYKTVFVDVRNASFVKIIPPATRSYCIGWVTEIGTVAADVVPSYVSSYRGIILSSIEAIYEVPDGANYLFVYLDKSSTGYLAKPSFLGLYSNASEGGGSEYNFNSNEQLTIDLNARRDRNLTEYSTIGLTQLNINTDSDGWEIPETLQQLNVQRKCEQLVNIRWTPKHNVPSKHGPNGIYPAGVEVPIGIPYSSNNDDGSKTVGEETSIYTFMTAVDNPYSMMYTECVNSGTKFHPTSSYPNVPMYHSYWGKDYTKSGNGFAYYGTVCCGLTSSVVNSPLKWNNPVINNYVKTNGVFIPVCTPGTVNFNLLKIGDTFDNNTHSFIVYGIHRNSNGEIDRVKYAESSTGIAKSNYEGVGGCRIGNTTAESFVNMVNRSGNPFTMLKYVKLWDNTDYEPSEFVPLTDRGETASTITYNNAICTFAGDKCTFRETDLIVVNYNLYDEQEYEWTSIEVYKDDVLIDTYTLAEAEDTLQNYLNENEIEPNPFDSSVVENNHALVLGTDLTAGMYKARMIDGNGHSSDYTYWEVVSNDLTWVQKGEDEYEITVPGNNLIQVIYVNGMYYLPTFEEQMSRKFTVRPQALERVWGYNYDAFEVSVKLKGVYGNIRTVPVELTSGEVEPEDEGDVDD